MANVRYVFGDALSGSVIEEISLYGVSMTRSFGAGDFRGSFQLDQTGKNNSDLLDATEEGRSFIICERDNTPIWGGIVWTRTYQSQAKVFQLYCKAFEHYPDSRAIRSDLTYTNTEQRNIFLNLWTSMMSVQNSLQFTLPPSFVTAVSKSLTVKALENKKYRTAMDMISNGDNGFDWTIDIARIGGAYTKTLRIGYPTLGATEPLDLDYPGQIVNYWQNGTMADRGTHFYFLGAGEGSSSPFQEVIHADLISSGFPRYDVVVSLSEVNDQAILTPLAVQIASIRKPGVPIFTVEVKGDQEPQFGGYGLGDVFRLNFRDPRHVNHIDRIFTTRLVAFEYYPPSDDHVEYARLMFAGEL